MHNPIHLGSALCLLLRLIIYKSETFECSFAYNSTLSEAQTSSREQCLVILFACSFSCALLHFFCFVAFLLLCCFCFALLHLFVFLVLVFVSIRGTDFSQEPAV